MNNQELEKRNKILERRWKIMLALAIVFLITRPVAVYVLEHVKHKAAQQATTNQYPLLDPARQYIPQGDYVISLNPLRDYLNQIAAQYPNNVSVYYEQLNSGANTSANANLRLFPASLTKLPLAIVVGRRVDDGVWNWNTKLTIQQSDIDSGSGNLYKTVKAGDTMTVDDLLHAMIVDSDNTAQDVFLDQMKQADFDNFEQAVGLEDLFDNQGFISSKEYTRVLRVLWTASYTDRDDAQKILDLMSQDTFHDFLSQGIPSNVIFAHKWGENKDQSIFADSGIVYQDGKPYMITVIIKGKDQTMASLTAAESLMKDISTHAYEAGEGN